MVRSDKLEPMKRILIVLIASIALLGSSQSQAGSYSFGISLQNFGYYPVPHVHIGYDFGTAVEGFSLEVSLFTLLFVNDIGLNAMYRFPVVADGSNIYAGAGASMFVLLFIPGAQSTPASDSSMPSVVNTSFSPLVAPQVYGTIGWEAPINSNYTYFLEVSPGIAFSTVQTFLLRFTIGLRAHRTEFLTRL
jgi:hypothetical protein